MFKVIDLAPEGKPEESVDIARVAPPAKGTIRWIDLVGTDRAALDLLRERFGFHHLALDDCAHFQMRSKIEEYDGFLFVVLHTFTADPKVAQGVQVHEVHAFLTDDTLVTVHDNPLPAQQQVWARALEDAAMLRRGPCWALYMTADVMVDAVFPLLEQMGDELERVEQALFARPRKRELQQIFRIKRSLVVMRRVAMTLRDAVGSLSRRGDPRVRERTALYFRDVHDHVLRCDEEIDEDLLLASNAMEAYRSAVTNRANDVMKSLTIMSAIFLPLSFIVGFWGQNFRDLPIGSHMQFWIMMGMIFSFPVGLLWWFKAKGWLK